MRGGVLEPERAGDYAADSALVSPPSLSLRPLPMLRSPCSRTQRSS